MKVDAEVGFQIDLAGRRAACLERLGCSGAFTVETAHDPFLPLVEVARCTDSIDIMTSIAVAFGRNPMIVANIGHDLNALSKGRFVLGLGSQIAPHITKRFSMPWSHPAPRMREFILALRSIWACWHRQEKLEFRGHFYTHTLMTPNFTPTNIEFGAPKILLAAVGPKTAEVAGEVADGIIVHSFTTESYLRNVTLPSVARGRQKAGKSAHAFEIGYPMFVVSGRTEEEFELSRTAVRRKIAFYASTPAYRPVLDSVGLGSLQDELNPMSKRGAWNDMGELIDDNVLREFAVVGSISEVAAKIKSKFGGLITRTFVPLDRLGEEAGLELIRTLVAV